MLASPAINPVVLISTAVAFPGQPSMVLARFVASLAVAVGMGWLWLRFGQPAWLRQTHRDLGQAGHSVQVGHLGPVGRTERTGPAERMGPLKHGWPAFWATCRLDVVRAGGFLVLGALAAAVLTVAAPSRWLAAIAANPIFSVVALALLAVLLSICSEADAFVVASLSQFSLTARLAFLVVGPVVDLRSFAAQSALVGPRFAVRFAPATLITAVVASALVGWVIF
jgi:uncharacterized membrane protein YraQ (UPF0718 family)